MITIKHGSIFDSRAAVLVCPVNCVGVMGKGLALEFKKRFPKMEAAYKKTCKAELLPVGSASTLFFGDPPAVMMAFTKQHWRHPSRLEWVDGCLVDVVYGWKMLGFDSIAIPQLGCGCGGLDWADVWPLYERHLGELDCDVEVWIHESNQ